MTHNRAGPGATPVLLKAGKRHAGATKGCARGAGSAPLSALLWVLFLGVTTCLSGAAGLEGGEEGGCVVSRNILFMYKRQVATFLSLSFGRKRVLNDSDALAHIFAVLRTGMQGTYTIYTLPNYSLR